MNDTARILVLGPLDLRVGDASLALGAPRQRALLALLALARGHVKPVTAIIDEVWGEQPPPTVVNAVQVYVASLRKVLAPASLGSSLVTQSPGYRLMLPPGTLDLDDFEAARRSGIEHAARGDHHGAAAAHRTALDHWRGPALADLDGAPFVVTERAMLEELRLSTVLGWVHALLAMGQHDEALPAVERELSQSPLHEALWGLRATALYQAGRQSDALAVLRRARRMLSRELGVDPGPELADVERRILAHDPTLGPTTRRQGGSALTHVATSATSRASVVLPDGRRVQLPRRPLVLGRHADCEIVLDHRDVSRRHARISTQARGHLVEDLGSTNGTAINGDPLVADRGARVLRHGDRIEIGPLIVRYEAGAAGS